MKEHNLKDLEKTIGKRISRRAFLADKKLQHDAEQQILQDNEQTGHFGEQHRIYILDSAKLLQEGKNINDAIFFNWISLVQHGGKDTLAKAVFKGLTYKATGGKVFKDGGKWMPPSYLVSIVKGGFRRSDSTSFGDYEVNYGYIGMAAEFYKKLLKAKEIGIDSCIHGIIKKKKFLYESIPCSEEWSIPLLSPLGYSPDNLTLWEEKVRNIHNAKYRVPVEEISFDCDRKKIDPRGLPEGFFEVLTLITRGPSAGNNQPWRFYFEEGTMHMCVDLSGKDSYRENHLREMDAGIAMATISMLQKKDGWELLDNIKINKSAREVYIASWNMRA